MQKIIMIVGETACGKDKIVDYISNKYNIKPVVSYTTRPIRSSEADGREHWFITKEKMKQLLETEHIFAYTKIEDKKKTEIDGYEYCTTLESITEDKNLYVIDPKGIKSIDPQILTNVELCVIYIYVPYQIRKQRASVRSDFNKFVTRTLQEKDQFNQFIQHKEYDYMVENTDFSIACEQVDKIMNTI